MAANKDELCDGRMEGNLFLRFNWPRMELLHIEPKLTRRRHAFEVALVKFLPVFLGFEQVLIQLLAVAPDDELEFVEIAGPAEPVEEFRAGKLRFVERVVRVARSEIQMLRAPLGE